MRKVSEVFKWNIKLWAYGWSFWQDGRRDNAKDFALGLKNMKTIFKNLLPDKCMSVKIKVSSIKRFANENKKIKTK